MLLGEVAARHRPEPRAGSRRRGSPDTSVPAVWTEPILGSGLSEVIACDPSVSHLVWSSGGSGQAFASIEAIVQVFPKGRRRPPDQPQPDGEAMTAHVLTLRCNNQPGIVAAVATRLARRTAATSSRRRSSTTRLTGKFFMRVAFRMDESGRCVRGGASARRWIGSGCTGRCASAGAAAESADPGLDVRPLPGRPALPHADRRAADGRGRRSSRTIRARR